MADYRFSAKPISRAKGQSSVASAAYRSASHMVDERTGDAHDYTRKRGVVHSEILAPEGTPDWMQDRTQLWNAVEAVEKRKNSQLAREIQLSLPHELTDEQRRDLAREFVQEQFVDLGMIADLNIHHPDHKSDERNHHAHVMLTMRELTGEGFHPKKATERARSWNSDDLLKTWRAQWAHHQNRALERHGHEARVDHRSYEDRGIDRDPTHHLGPVANDMESNGKPSRIGDENRVIEDNNGKRAKERAEYAQATAVLAQEYAKLTAKQDEQSRRLSADLETQNTTAKLTITTEIEAIDRRLGVTGARKLFRDLFGRTKADMANKQELTQSLEQIRQREDQRRRELERQQRTERKDLEHATDRWKELERSRAERHQRQNMTPEQRSEERKQARAKNSANQKPDRWSELERLRRKNAKPATDRWTELERSRKERNRGRGAIPKGEPKPSPDEKPNQGSQPENRNRDRPSALSAWEQLEQGRAERAEKRPQKPVQGREAPPANDNAPTPPEPPHEAPKPPDAPSGRRRIPFVPPFVPPKPKI